jgi:hypothetical protein
MLWVLEVRGEKSGAKSSGWKGGRKRVREIKKLKSRTLETEGCGTPVFPLRHAPVRELIRKMQLTCSPKSAQKDI